MYYQRQIVQICFEDHPFGTGAITLQVKQAGREAERSPPSSANDKNGGSMPPLTHTSA
jgi:hypothetical protein